MTRKHFVKLAAALNGVEANFPTCKSIALVCAENNSGFDFEKFFIACGLYVNKLGVWERK